jgi:hypothetical protein
MKSMIRYTVISTVIFLSTLHLTTLNAQPCSTAGTASVSTDSICSGASSTLGLAGFVGAIQWQSYDGAMWNNETGTGSTTASYTVSPTTNTDYRAVVTDVGCDPDTSNIVTVSVGLSAPVTTGATRCGYGSVTLSATGTGIKWYDVATGGTSLGSGPSFTTTVSSTKTFYAASSLGGGPPTPLTTTFAGGNGFDGNMFDITALNQVTIDSFAANFNAGSGTAEIWYRPGTHVGFTGSNAGWTLAGTAPYTSTGNGAPGTLINVYVNVTIPAGQTYAFYVHGSGGITYTNGTGVGNLYIQDANIQVFEGFGGAYFNLTNSPRVFNGRIMYSAGCESPRAPAVATVNTPPAMSINANPPALCQGQSSTLTAVSSNPGYNYTWSPATGLSGTTGSTVTASPMTPITYTLIGDDGTCGNIDSVFISVGPASVAGTATITSDTICFGSVATLNLTGNTGNIQWQSYDGSMWVNETGPGSTSNQYTVSPPSFTQYRAVVTSGGCDPDTTVTLDLTVLTINDPVTVNDTLCGPGTANLLSNGTGNMNWFTTPTGGNSIFTGGTYNPSVSTTTTWYVEASAGANYNVGAPNLGIGTQILLAGNDWGLQFNVTQQIVLERVYVSPGPTSGNITINLRATQGGPILNTMTKFVTAFTGLQPVDLGFTIPPGTGYRLEMATGSVQCYYNSFGGSYPYTFPGSSVTITGYVNPAFGSGNFYYWFYNWQINEGCSSNRVPVTAVVHPAVPVPTISQNGTILTSSSSVNNQWYNNGVLIPGATAQTYDMGLSGSGTYTVVVTDPATGCSAQSLPVVYTGISENLAAAGIRCYPNPVIDVINLDFTQNSFNGAQVRIFNSLGELMLKTEIHRRNNSISLSGLAAGIYNMEISASGSIYRTAVVKQ